MCCTKFTQERIGPPALYPGSYQSANKRIFFFSKINRRLNCRVQRTRFKTRTPKSKYPVAHPGFWTLFLVSCPLCPGFGAFFPVPYKPVLFNNRVGLPA